MIVNIYKSDCSTEISNLPRLDIRGHEMCVKRIYAEFYHEITQAYITLTSFMVCRNELNPEQEIFSFSNNSFFPHMVDHEPISKCWYPVNIQNLDEATINMKISNIKIKTVRKLHLQLEFRKIE